MEERHLTVQWTYLHMRRQARGDRDTTSCAVSIPLSLRGSHENNPQCAYSVTGLIFFHVVQMTNPMV